MRSLLRVLPLLTVSALVCNMAAARPEISALQRALAGSWAGTLEYRDYSESAASSKRVKLPTWLDIEPVGADLRFRYIYDDGPTKTVTETAIISIDPATARYTESNNSGKVEDSYAIAGLDQLRQGRGSLILTGTGTGNDAPVQVRTTLRIGRNILEITRETAVAGQPFAFRHAYLLVRTAPPAS